MKRILLTAIAVVVVIVGLSPRANAHEVSPDAYRYTYEYDWMSDMVLQYELAPLPSTDLCPGIDLVLINDCSETRRTVHALYMTIANRPPSLEEMHYWSWMITIGVAPITVAEAMVHGFGLDQLDIHGYARQLFENVSTPACFGVDNHGACFNGTAIEAAISSATLDLDHGKSREQLAVDVATLFQALGAFRFDFAGYVDTLRHGFDPGARTLIASYPPK